MSTSSLTEFLQRHARLLVLTGAGCSTDSGLPDYRDRTGEWKHPRPVTYQAFVGDSHTRARYWARSMAGWERFKRARPNDAHKALARLEELGRVRRLVTQNVDGLHQAAGSQRVTDLHGRLDRVRCLGCDASVSRHSVQEYLRDRNPRWASSTAGIAPDGDAVIPDVDLTGFKVPLCSACAGPLKPDVVFFGESIPQERKRATMDDLAGADAVLVVGSSLMVYSGFRIVRAAVAMDKPIAAVNLGLTRADEHFAVKVEAPCATALAAAVSALSGDRVPALTSLPPHHQAGHKQHDRY